MRTQEQIDYLQKFETPPVMHEGAVSTNDIQELLFFYNNSKNVILKNTGPKVLHISQTDNSIVDKIINYLKTQHGNFEVRSIQFFDVTRPHIIHNDDDKKLPNVYKAFTIPLWADGNDTDIGLVMFDQFYYNGPAKFINGETQESPTYINQFVRDYKNVCNTVNGRATHPDLSHLREHWLQGLSVHTIFPWKIGNIIAFESLRLHSSTDFLSKGIKRKIGLSIFTNIGDTHEKTYAN